MSARDGAVRIQDQHGRDLLGRPRHIHDCGHGCDCYVPSREVCRNCQTKAFNDAMAQRYREDSLTTEQLLERRA